MPWNTSYPVEDRRNFISEWILQDRPVANLCLEHGISRKTGHKWIQRYREQGLSGLEALSQAPYRPFNTTPKIIEKAIVSLRGQHPHWGPRKILHRLSRISPEIRWPAASTMGAILKRNGLSAPRKRMIKAPIRQTPLQAGKETNDVWAADFMGWFRTRDGRRIDPLTVTDWASRYLIGCHGMEYPSFQNVRTRFELLFRKFGLPRTIRTDNGAPFAGAGLGGLSRLSVWWIRLGILPERIRPAHPEENGRHERMHRTMRAATAAPPRLNFRAQQTRFSAFQREFNEERPHEALGMRTPAEIYRASDRPYPTRLPEIEYGSDYHVRRVHSRGQIKWAGHLLFISDSLVGQAVGLQQIDDRLWGIHFGPIVLGVLDEKTLTIRRV